MITGVVNLQIAEAALDMHVDRASRRAAVDRNFPEYRTAQNGSANRFAQKPREGSKKR
jgi:hypothetical protein